MKLVNALSKIAKLPKILEQYGIAPENVLNLEYCASTTHDINVLVQLHTKEAIQKLGVCEIESTLGYDDAHWKQFRIIMEGIAFICWEREDEAIA